MTNDEIADKYADQTRLIIDGLVQNFRANGCDESEVARKVVGALVMSAIVAGEELGVRPVRISLIMQEASDFVFRRSGN
jgi:hypothetical protein